MDQASKEAPNFPTLIELQTFLRTVLHFICSISLVLPLQLLYYEKSLGVLYCITTTAVFDFASTLARGKSRQYTVIHTNHVHDFPPPHSSFSGWNNIGAVRRHQDMLQLFFSWSSRRLSSLVVGLVVLLILSFSPSRQHVAYGMVTVPSTNVSYPSIPAWYYGKVWDTSTTSSPLSTNSTIPATTGEEEVGAATTVHLQYYDIDYCNEFATVAKDDDDNTNNSIYHRSPIKPSPIEEDDMSSNSTNNASTVAAEQHLLTIPIALLVYDSDHGAREVKHRPCHLIDYERLAIAWNVTYVIFYHDEPNNEAEVETEKAGMPTHSQSTPSFSRSSLNSYYEQNQAYLDSPIVSETNSIGFQLVSHRTATGKSIGWSSFYERG